MRDARFHTGFVKGVNLGPRNRVVLSTNCDVHNEIFASLEYLSEIPEVGKLFIAQRCSAGTDIDFAYSLFQSFVRQAKTFYNSARSLDSHASPLNYYYSFLNLVKAYISLTEPDVVSKKILHGLAHSFSDSDLKTQFVSATPIDAVFGRFYKKLFEVSSPPNLQLSIVNLLGYCTDIVHEYHTGGFGIPKTFMAKFNVAANNNQAFGNLVINGFQFFDSETINTFTQCFEEVKPNKAAVREEFDIYASELDHLSFFETKKTYPLPTPASAPTEQIVQDCQKALKHVCMSNPYKDTSDFLICLPLTEVPYVPFNEVAAIYAIMYYLGSLIRYYPRYLEKLLHSKDAWIIERFCEGSPSTFLRHISNLILDEDRVYVRR